MKKLFQAAALSLTLVVSGCGPAQSVLTGGWGVTTQIKNPVGKSELAKIELSYQVASKIFVACRQARCTSKGNLQVYQAYDRKAYAAIVAARPVVRNNPTVSGLSVLVLARQAVADYQSVIQGVR